MTTDVCWGRRTGAKVRMWCRGLATRLQSLLLPSDPAMPNASWWLWPGWWWIFDRSTQPWWIWENPVYDGQPWLQGLWINRAKRSVLPRTSSMQGAAFWMLYNPLLWMEWTCSRTSGVYTVILQWESAINSGRRQHTDFYYHRVCQVLWCQWQGCLHCSLDLLQSTGLSCCWPTQSGLPSTSHSTETEAVFPSAEYAAAEPRNAYQTWFFFLSGGRGKMR